MLPDFTRLAWASADARAVWEPRVRSVSAALLDMEVQAVRDGVRPVALQFTPDVASLRRFADLAFAPVTAGRCAIAKEQATVDAFLTAWHAHDDVNIGRFLGFPECCVQFFHDVWNTQKLRDTTMSMAHPEKTGSTSANILGRWLGVRLVPHLPCSWACERTHGFAKALAASWDPQALAWADEILSWPVEYSALHGIAIVTFPVVKVVTNTDYTKSTHVIRREGTRYPAEAATGLQFPFQKPRAQVLTMLAKPVDAREWTDNGFQTKAAMAAAHDMVLKAVAGYGTTGLEVIDLGCGNGRLLDSIPAVFKVGVESDVDRAARGKARGRDIRVGRIQDLAALVTESFGLALISARRLEEFTAAQRVAFDAWCRGHVANVLVYSYDAPQFAKVEGVPCTV